MSLAPLAVFAYNRLPHFRQCIEALAANLLAPESDLTVFLDGPKTPADSNLVDQVRKFARQIRGFRSLQLVERESNIGLSASIIRGVTECCDTSERVIVVEDDLVTAPHFLQYMNEALDLYQHEERVASIHGHTPPMRQSLPETYFLHDPGCWGWATWKRAWAHFEPDGAKLLATIQDRRKQREFDWNGAYPYTALLRDQVLGHNDSWAIRWYATSFLKGSLTLHPGRSLVRNIGFDGTGTHCKPEKYLQAPLAESPITLRPIEIRENKIAHRAMAEHSWEQRFPRWPRRFAAQILSKARLLRIPLGRPYP